MIRIATQADHAELVALAKQFRSTRDFSHMMFSGEHAYQKGWIRCSVPSKGDRIQGFTCVRHKVRTPETKLYYIVVDPECHSMGVGQDLLKDLQKQSPHKRVALDVEKENTQARNFYDRYGFHQEGESLHGKGLRLVLEWE